MVILTQQDHGSSISAQVGDRIIIQLQENPTTGFQWSIEQTNDEVLILQSSDYQSAREGVLGGSGQRIFTFAVQGHGTANLHLKLWRKWQGDSSIVERFSVTLQT